MTIPNKCICLLNIDDPHICKACWPNGKNDIKLFEKKVYAELQKLERQYKYKYIMYCECVDCYEGPGLPCNGLTLGPCEIDDFFENVLSAEAYRIVDEKRTNLHMGWKELYSIVSEYEPSEYVSIINKLL